MRKPRGRKIEDRPIESPTVGRYTSIEESPDFKNQKFRREYTRDDGTKVKMPVTEMRHVNSQAGRIISKFGSPYKLAKALVEANPEWKLDPSTIYRWRMPKHRYGTNGLIPAKHLERILHTARLFGIFIEDTDLNPIQGAKRRGPKCAVDVYNPYREKKKTR